MSPKLFYPLLILIASAVYFIDWSTRAQRYYPLKVAQVNTCILKPQTTYLLTVVIPGSIYLCVETP